MLIAADRKPEVARALAESLHAALTEENFEAAFAVTETMIECWPESAGAWTASGLMALKLGRLEDASYRLGSALTLAPHDFDAHYNLALVDIQRGNYKAALKRLIHLRHNYPDNAELLNDIGVLWLRREKPDRSLASFVRSLTVNPNQADALDNALNLCLRNGWTDRARRALEDIGRRKELTPETQKAIKHWRLRLTRPEELDMAAFLESDESEAPAQ